MDEGLTKTELIRDPRLRRHPLNLADFLEAAYAAFLCCRHRVPDVEAILDQLIEEMAVLPTTEIAALPLDRQRLLDFIRLVIPELRRLCSSAEPNAIRSLGYAVHPLPHPLRRDEQFDAMSFRFNFRIVASHWFVLSADVREALCNLVNVDRARAEVLVSRPDFPIKMFSR